MPVSDFFCVNFQVIFSKLYKGYTKVKSQQKRKKVSKIYFDFLAIFNGAGQILKIVTKTKKMTPIPKNFRFTKRF